MSENTGTVKNGLVVLDDASGFAEGSRVVVLPVESSMGIGLCESEWQDTPEAIADWIAWYDSLEPLEMEKSDEQAVAAFREQQKQAGISGFDERAERLSKIWR